MTLPMSPSTLCFDRNCFLGSDFSVDVFLHDHRNAASLETMRDDLGMYLKVLRSAMIDLINKDYADFVNLSANLIGLDGEIDKIRFPLRQLREEVSKIDGCLSEAMRELSGRLERKMILRDRKRSLQYLSQTQNSLRKLSSMLNIDNFSKNEITRELVERASSEYNRLRFTITKCEPFISPEQKQNVEKIGNIIETTLGEMLLNGLKMKKIDITQRCLQIFSMLDRTSMVESLLRKNVVAPAMHGIISESSLQKNPLGLKGIYVDILRFVDEELKDTISITKINKVGSVKGYRILLNSFWPEVEYRLEVHMSSIFAPGNPELFFSRYNESLYFLKKLEEYFDDSNAIEQFHSHPQYRNFHQKWNLPIYFQIRFQEIAGSLENVLSDTMNLQNLSNELCKSKEYYLNVTSVCWTSLTSCWERGVFIVALTHRFFKLSLQIISRFCTWIDVMIKQPWSNQSNQNNSSSESVNNEKNYSEKLKFLIYLYSDIRKLINDLPTLLEIIKTRLDSFSRFDILEKCLSDSKISLESRLPQIQKIIVVQISAESIIHLKQLTDIPRLFRKTNRDMPTKPCNYVNVLIKCPNDFHSTYKSIVGDEQITNWSEDIFSMITVQYFVAVNDVLTSVQKTEDSLRRLKQIRDRTTHQTSDKSGVTDDDKIRMQLKVDVDAYCLLLTEIKINFKNVEKLNELILLTDRAISAKSNT